MIFGVLTALNSKIMVFCVCDDVYCGTHVPTFWSVMKLESAGFPETWYLSTKLLAIVLLQKTVRYTQESKKIR